MPKKISTKPKISEHQLQCLCVQWFRIKYPKRLIFAIPNGGLRNDRVAFKLKREGVTPGVPDLFVPEPTSTHSGLFVELKVGYNKVKKGGNQESMISELAKRGYLVAVVRDFESFQTLVEGYFK